MPYWQWRSQILDQLEYVLSICCFVRLFRVDLHVVYLTARLVISRFVMRQTASRLDTIGSSMATEFSKGDTVTNR